MAETPTFCMLSEAIGSCNAIAKVAQAGVMVALNAGYKVTVIANRLDESLIDKVEWIPLYVPSRGFYVKWVSAEYFMKRALGNRKFDIVHSHQPQAAHISDVFQCHFLTRISRAKGCFTEINSVKSAAKRLQEEGVLRAEDRYYGSWNQSTRMLYVSSMIKQQFEANYPAPQHAAVLSNAVPPLKPVSATDKREARKALLGDLADFPGPVLGYIGGCNPRKGYRELIASLEASADNILLLMGGPRSNGFDVPALSKQGRFRCVGLTDNPAQFYNACDVMAVPSYFDPCPLVVYEAVSRRVPVIASNGVGNLPDLIEYGAGLEWQGGTPVAPLVQHIVSNYAQFQTGADLLASRVSTDAWCSNLLSVYTDVLASKGIASV